MENQNAGLSAEQDADLRRLEGMAAEGDQGQGPEMVEAGPAYDPAESWAVLPAIVEGRPGFM